MTRSLAALVAFACLLGSALIAQPLPDGWQGGLVLRGESSGFLTGERAGAAPLLRYQTDRFSVGLDGARYGLGTDGGPEVQLILRPRRPGFYTDDLAYAGMSREMGFDLGARVATRGAEGAGGFGLSLTAMQGLTDAQRGQELDLRFSRQMGDRLPITFFAGAAWQSRELTEYLYGVRSDEAASGRPAYSPGGAITPYIGVSGTLPLTDSAAIIGTVEAFHLPDQITSSPIVGEAGAARARLGVVFNF